MPKNINKYIQRSIPSKVDAYSGPTNTVLDTVYGDTENQVMTSLYDKKDPNVVGSSIPYLNNVYGDILAPSSSVNVTTYLRMYETDPVIFRSIQYLISLISNTISEYRHPNKKIQKLIRYYLKKMKTVNCGTFNDIKLDACSMIWAGFTISELEFDYDEEYGYYYISKSYPLPPSSLGYKVTPEGEIKCVLQSLITYLPYQMQNLGNYGFAYGLNGSMSPLPASGYQGYYDNNIVGGYGNNPFASRGNMDFPQRVNTITPIGVVEIAKEKCAIGIFNIGYASGDPFGASVCRPIYTDWLRKLQIKQNMVTLSDRGATPTTVCYADPSYNYKVGDKIINGMKAAQGFKDFHAGSFIVVPGKKDTAYTFEVLQNQANLQFYIDAIDEIDQKIREGLFASTGTENGSYAKDVKTGQTNDRIIAVIRDKVIDMLLNGYVRKILELNFDDPNEYDNDIGSFTTLILDINQKLQLAKLYEVLDKEGYMSNTNRHDVTKVRIEQDLDLTSLEELINDNEKSKELEIQQAESKVNVDEAKDVYTNSGVDSGM